MWDYDDKADEMRQSMSRKSAQDAAEAKAVDPLWASGLRQIYSAVLEEPLPASFDDLLKKLDEAVNDGR